VDVVATNKKGQYIDDLTQKNFKVWEDNKEQPIKTFSYGPDPSAPDAGKLETAASVQGLSAFEGDLTSASEPSDCLRAAREPDFELFKVRNQPHIKVTPKSFRSGTAVMPKKCQNTAKSARVFNKAFAKLPCLRFSQTHALREKQSAILNV